MGRIGARGSELWTTDPYFRTSLLNPSESCRRESAGRSQTPAPLPRMATPLLLPPKFVTMSLNWADYWANGITWDEAHSFKYTTSLCLLLSLDIIFALLLFDIK
jgi:hypothetical protein